MGIPFKMKGSPMQRNFNIESPVKTKGHGYDDKKHVHKVRPAGYTGDNNSTSKGEKKDKKKKPDFPPIGVEVVI